MNICFLTLFAARISSRHSRFTVGQGNLTDLVAIKEFIVSETNSIPVHKYFAILRELRTA